MSNQFGKMISAFVLEARIEEYCPNLKKKISNFIAKYYEGFKKLEVIECDSKFKKNMFLIWRNNFISKINFHESVDTYVENVIRTHYKLCYMKHFPKPTNRKERRSKINKNEL